MSAKRFLGQRVTHPLRDLVIRGAEAANLTPEFMDATNGDVMCGVSTSIDRLASARPCNLRPVSSGHPPNGIRRHMPPTVGVVCGSNVNPGPTPNRSTVNRGGGSCDTQAGHCAIVNATAFEVTALNPNEVRVVNQFTAARVQRVRDLSGCLGSRAFLAGVPGELTVRVDGNN